MNNEKMALFIQELRKEKKMTQKELAVKLNVTDKAVSKWERGLSYPDIALIIPLSELLGVTATELLHGERSTPYPMTDPNVETALQYASKATQSKLKYARTAGKLLLSVFCLIAIAICIICDIAITGKLTWSLYPIYSVSFAWLVLFPLLQFKKHSVRISLLSASVFVIPFLFALNPLIDTNGLLLQMGIRISVVAIGFLWIVYLVFSVVKTNPWNAATISALLAILVSFLMNLIISNYINQPPFDIWDILADGILTVIAIVFFSIGQYTQKKACK